jgi:hypothetical protein
MKTSLPFLPLAVSIATLLALGRLAHAAPVPPFVLTEVAKVGDAVPDGTAGEVFTKFFTPAINNAGNFGLFAQTRNTDGIKSETFLNILGDFSAGMRLLTKGEALAEAPSLTIGSLRNPAFNAQGSLGVLFKLGGTTSLDDSAVGFLAGSTSTAANFAAGNGEVAGSTLHIAARENSAAPGTTGLFNSFKTLVLGDQRSIVASASGAGTNGPVLVSSGTVFFSASLKRVEPSITSANDYGVWTYSDFGGTENLLLEGNTYDLDGTDHVLKSFRTLTAPSLGYSQGHSVRGDTLVALARFSDGLLSVVKASEGGPVDPVVSSGDLVTDLTGVTYKSFGVPSLASDGISTVLAKLSNKTFRISSFLPASATTRLDSTSPVPGIPGAVLTKVRDPQVNAENDFVALGKISDLDTESTLVTTQTDEVIVGDLDTVLPPLAPRHSAGTNGLPPVATYEIFAREGDIAPGAGTATFDQFRSILLPDREMGGVLFSASLTIDGTAVTSANNDGIWGFTPGAGLQKIVREGDIIDFGDGNVTVTKIVAFKAVSGSADHQRSGGASGRVLILLRTLPATGSSIYRVVSIERDILPG